MTPIYVSCDLGNKALPLGTIYVDSIRGKESYSFEFETKAIEEGYASILIDGDIALIRGRQFKNDSGAPYHFMEDSSPDRWGRNLLRKSRGGKTLQEVDYLLGVSDITRIGALRYRLEKEGPYFSSETDIPPYRFLRELEDAAYSFDFFAKDDRWKVLLAPGSSLGGARPKANIYGVDHALHLAKFSHKNDDYDVPRLEYFTYLMATSVGILMSASQLVRFGNSRSAFLTKRFDRQGDTRIPFVSFMTLLNGKDGESSSYSYLDVAESLSRLSDAPKEDLRQLYLRISFNLLMRNYDDHLRNHAMIHVGDKWRLSPAFDLNVSFDKSSPELATSEKGSGIGELIDSAPYYGLRQQEGESIVLAMKKDLKRHFASCCEKAFLPEEMRAYLEDLLFKE